MYRMTLLVVCLWTVVAGVVEASWAQETSAAASLREAPLRSFSRFEFDPVTANNVWLEVAAATAQDHRSDAEVEYSAHTGFLRLVYGQRLWEGGLVFPFSNGYCFEVGNDNCEGNSGIGDLSLYGKLLPLDVQVGDGVIRGGMGFEIGVPTGNQNEFLGTGEVGMLPFGTVGGEWKGAAVRAYGGYQFYGSTSQTAREAVVYGGGLYYRVNDQLAFRSDFVALMVDNPGGSQPTSATWDPGFDVRFPLDAYRLAGVDLLLRVNASIGMTTQSPEWGFGGGFAATWGWEPF